MALQATEQGSRRRAKAAADPDLTTPRPPIALGGTGCSKRSAVAGLPDDALVEILSRLPAKSLCRSKCVSKAWCDLITDRLRCRKLPHTLEGFFYGCVHEDGGSSDDDDDDDDGSSQDDDEDGSEDDDEGGSKDKTSSRHAYGHFINLLGRSVPLVDPSFSVLRDQSGIRNLTLLDSCNGLLLFGFYPHYICGTPNYIVYNPATEHWVGVPSSGIMPSMLIPFNESEDEDRDDDNGVSTHLMFDPVTSSRFQLIEFCYNPEVAVVQTYSSKTERWSERRGERKRWKKGGEWDLQRTLSSFRGMRCTAYFNNLLHLIVNPSTGPELITAIDGKGKTCRVYRWLENHGFPVFVGQSNGLLHCISVSGHPDGNSSHMTELSIWVLADYDAEEWNLKHTVSFLELFGKKSCQFGSDYSVATIHPDRNLVFFVQHWDYKLISYNMDLKEVDALCTVGCDYGTITPYIPYFSEIPALSKKH